jgi:hypothetical protein
VKTKDPVADRIPNVVLALTQGLITTFGQRLIGVYLGGSFSMGDFVAASSDYDILIVIDDDLTLGDLSTLGKLHERLMRDDLEAARLEGDYVPRRVLVPEGTSEPVPSIRHGRFEPNTAEIMLSADNIANMCSQGIAVYGPPASEVLPMVSPSDVRAAVQGMLLDGIDECSTEAEAAFELLNLVRSLCALETGQPTTKSEGVSWALGHLEPRWHHAIRGADAIRRGAEAEDAERTLRDALTELDRVARSLYESRGNQ